MTNHFPADFSSHVGVSGVKWFWSQKETSLFCLPRKVQPCKETRIDRIRLSRTLRLKQHHDRLCVSFSPPSVWEKKGGANHTRLAWQRKTHKYLALSESTCRFKYYSQGNKLLSKTNQNYRFWKVRASFHKMYPALKSLWPAKSVRKRSFRMLRSVWFSAAAKKDHFSTYLSAISSTST